MHERIIDKWDAKECRDCKHLGSLKEGVMNIAGERMTPDGYFFRRVCKVEHSFSAEWTGSRRRTKKCLYKETRSNAEK